MDFKIKFAHYFYEHIILILYFIQDKEITFYRNKQHFIDKK